MKPIKINAILFLGVVAITGILVLQLFLMRQAYSNEELKFNQKVHVGLLEVVKKLYNGEVAKMPLTNPINKISEDYYLVNVNKSFEMKVLEFYLITEFQKGNIKTDFEYAIYQCESDKMLYGNYISLDNKPKAETDSYFPKYSNLVYYFAVRFPKKSGYVFSELKLWVALSCVLFLILLIYIYTIYIILKQKRFSELQKDFINNMTHEFKTPLSSILIASNYLSEQPQIYKDEKMDKYTGIIINQSHKLNKHVERILDLARLDSSPLKLDKKETDAIVIIKNVIENIQLKYPLSEIKIDCKDEVFMLALDEFHFTNMVYNLIDNSIKYSNKTPQILIKLNGNEKSIKFIDNGIGIAKKDQSYIFDKFFRVNNIKSNEVNGFGLGLYYVKKICLLHNWKIKADSKIDEGTEITITIAT